VAEWIHYTIDFSSVTGIGILTIAALGVSNNFVFQIDALQMRGPGIPTLAPPSFSQDVEEQSPDTVEVVLPILVAIITTAVAISLILIIMKKTVHFFTSLAP